MTRSTWTKGIQPQHQKLPRSEYPDNVTESRVKNWVVLHEILNPLIESRRLNRCILSFPELRSEAAAAFFPPCRTWFMALVMVQPVPLGIGLLCPDLIKQSAQDLLCMNWFSLASVLQETRRPAVTYTDTAEAGAGEEARGGCKRVQDSLVNNPSMRKVPTNHWHVGPGCLWLLRLHAHWAPV